MLNFLKPKKNTEKNAPGDEAPKQSWLGKLSRGLSRTRNQFTDKLATLALGKKEIDDEILEELETLLLTSDVGVETTDKILKELSQKIKRKELNNPEALSNALKTQLQSLLAPYETPLDIGRSTPFVILMVGVNGAGKTTSIAKLAHFYQGQGKKVMLAAGDTFRAAAVEQLKVWGDRNNVPVIAQHDGADSASVIYDAMQSATAKSIDVLIADTAGRLHTQSHLMDELAKIKRVMGKLNENAPHETMLILDASMGQNALNQAKQFHEAITLSSVSFTKLDGTAKAGIIFAVTDALNLPVRFIGVGEQMDDLKPFKATEFVDALFSE